jgi:rod shape determining protein RodA
MVKSSFASFVAIGISGVIGAHVLINVGMSLGLLPVIGIPLPFLSYGGSALLSGMMMMGILMNLYANRKEH